MLPIDDAPTSILEVNALLRELLAGVQRILGQNFVGMYLEGSLAGGDFDAQSDVDFVVVSAQQVSAEAFAQLAALHAGLQEQGGYWPTNLEGYYLPAAALRRHDPALGPSPNLERGSGERLKWVTMDESWNVHRAVLRGRGITLAGPDPQTLIDPVSPDDLRLAMQPALHGWAADLLAHPAEISHQGYQAYIVLTVCRILYTLALGQVASKPQAARWMQAAHGERWGELIARAWQGRNAPSLPADPAQVQQTLALLRYAQEQGGLE